MTYNINQSLNQMLSCSIALKQTQLNQQQQLFIDHIKKNIQRLTLLIDGIPVDESIYLQIIPVLGDQFLQPLVTAYGYAKLMIESPTSFGHVTLTPSQHMALNTIYQHGRQLEDYAKTLQEQAISYRLESRQQPLQPINLTQFLQQNAPVYHYWIRTTSTQLVIEIPDDPMIITTRPYHLNALLQHLVTTLANEVLYNGHITINLTDTHTINLMITPLQLTQTHMQTLFYKDGRGIYYKQLQQMNGSIELIRSIHGSTIVIQLVT